MYSLLRSLMFRLDPERAHSLALGSLRGLAAMGLMGGVKPCVATPRTVMGISFPNPVGLAAGLDKDGQCIDGLAALGFGFIEIGTVTPRPQSGNSLPRLFRLPEAEAIINRMGFNNRGVDHLVARVQASSYRGVLGINIGKNKDTDATEAANDYLHCLRKVYGFASYVTINISSPNTPGLRDLQFGEALERLLRTLKEEQARLADTHGRYVPLAVKIAPDLEDQEIDFLAETLASCKVDGVIATNTTSSREGVAHLLLSNEVGGLSGKPLTQKSTRVIARLRQRLGDAVPIIGVGGIMEAGDAIAKMEAGASLVQIYTGLIYRGPKLISEICHALQK